MGFKFVEICKANPRPPVENNMELHAAEEVIIRGARLWRELWFPYGIGYFEPSQAGFLGGSFHGQSAFTLWMDCLQILPSAFQRWCARRRTARAQSEPPGTRSSSGENAQATRRDRRARSQGGI